LTGTDSVHDGETTIGSQAATKTGKSRCVRAGVGLWGGEAETTCALLETESILIVAKQKREGKSLARIGWRATINLL
jgi:hypothetical protein